MGGRAVPAELPLFRFINCSRVCSSYYNCLEQRQAFCPLVLLGSFKVLKGYRLFNINTPWIKCSKREKLFSVVIVSSTENKADVY
jgi:hypothetical protein